MSIRPTRKTLSISRTRKISKTNFLIHNHILKSFTDHPQTHCCWHWTETSITINLIIQITKTTEQQNTTTTSTLTKPQKKSNSKPQETKEMSKTNASNNNNKTAARSITRRDTYNNNNNKETTSTRRSSQSSTTMRDHRVSTSTKTTIHPPPWLSPLSSIHRFRIV